jgi:hypothetical protein
MTASSNAGKRRGRQVPAAASHKPNGWRRLDWVCRSSASCPEGDPSGAAPPLVEDRLAWPGEESTKALRVLGYRRRCTPRP